MDPMESITLRTGQQVPRVALRATMMAIEALARRSPIYLFDLVEVAHGRPPFADRALAVFAELGLTAPGAGMHELTRTIVFAAFDGEGYDLAQVDPVRYQG